ncbi:hypothetical protein B0H16DRAFT_1670795 [Mycena metata]|uniref:G-patch domain-containing protein n=1 Tax=Mycena metata TaxID=1033252 RepID=A0AAD7KGV8_9AGAR|nr:hypothetical protein B0H16DRAFT_1670795 [Mycena metata]
MPLDSHSYLVAQGWTGSGTGLRQGAISRPLAIPQKKTLAGLGKERDEAFPFWDHLFSAASKSIQIKISKDGEDTDDDSDAEPNVNVSFKRTSTGILSNRRPVTGATPAHDSGATTPDTDDTSPRLTLLATAKREAAKRNLYSRFFKGPVLGPDSPLPTKPAAVFVVKEVVVVPPVSLPERRSAPSVDEPARQKKRKTVDGEEDEKREAKRLRREQKELKRAEKKSREKREGKKKEKEEKGVVVDLEAKREKKRKRKQDSEAEVVDNGEEPKKSKRKKDAETESGAQTEKRKRKEEKRRKKASGEVAIAPDVDAETGKKRKRTVD